MQIAISVYPFFTALDVVGPYQVLTQAPGVEVTLCAHRRGVVVDDNGLLRLEVENDLGDVPRPDIIVVPGGFGAQGLIDRHDRLLEWIADVHPTTRYTTSVCVGALLLGAVGVLDGVSATTHWATRDRLSGYGAQPSDERVVRAGRIWTAAGVSAGIDLALTLVAELQGAETAQAVQLGIEYDPAPPFDSGSPSKVASDMRDLVQNLFNATEAACRELTGQQATGS